MLQARFISTLSANACRRLETRLVLRYFSTLGTDVHCRWQRRCDRLTQLQRRIRFPPLDTITVRGETYELPLPSVDALRSPSWEELQYLVGFFDGDGCVSMTKETGEMRLSIGQNVDSAEVLFRFRSWLGGSIGRQSASTGSKKAKVQWRVYGSKMTAAAASLSTVPSMKQAQLLIAAKGYVAKSDRTRVAQHLQSFKRKLHVPDQCAECSWRYFTGFFDAEGCIMVRPAWVGLRLEVAQVNACILVHVLNFLHGKGLRAWKLYQGSACSKLVCTSLQECRQTLELLLENGLLVKLQQAELALILSAENHLHIRDAISSLNGWQGRYRRLDPAGIVRAQEIHRLQKRLRYIFGPGRATMCSQLEELRTEHNLQKLITRCSLLRKDMRQSLREGGQVVSQSTCSS